MIKLGLSQTHTAAVYYMIDLTSPQGSQSWDKVDQSVHVLVFVWVFGCIWLFLSIGHITVSPQLTGKNRELFLITSAMIIMLFDCVFFQHVSTEFPQIHKKQRQLLTALQSSIHRCIIPVMKSRDTSRLLCVSTDPPHLQGLTDFGRLGIRQSIVWDP